MEKMRIHDLKETKRLMENKLMLDTMEQDSQRWPSLVDMNERIDANVFLP